MSDEGAKKGTSREMRYHARDHAVHDGVYSRTPSTTTLAAGEAEMHAKQWSELLRYLSLYDTA